MNGKLKKLFNKESNGEEKKKIENLVVLVLVIIITVVAINYPITSIKINGNRLKIYNILDSGDTAEYLDKGHCNFNGKKITVKKYKNLIAKLYSDVYSIKFVNLRKNKKIKKNCQFVTKNKCELDIWVD